MWGSMGGRPEEGYCEGRRGHGSGDGTSSEQRPRDSLWPEQCLPSSAQGCHCLSLVSKMTKARWVMQAVPEAGPSDGAEARGCPPGAEPFCFAEGAKRARCTQLRLQNPVSHGRS